YTHWQREALPASATNVQNFIITPQPQQREKASLSDGRTRETSATIGRHHACHPVVAIALRVRQVALIMTPCDGSRRPGLRMMVVLVGLATVPLGLGASAAQAPWQRQTIRSEADFRGLCVVSTNVAWVGGTKGTFGRTTDGGTTWTVGTVPGADKLDFRDVEAF